MLENCKAEVIDFRLLRLEAAVWIQSVRVLLCGLGLGLVLGFWIQASRFEAYGLVSRGGKAMYRLVEGDFPFTAFERGGTT